MIRTLSGLQWHATSPSDYHQVGHPVRLHYDGQGWLITIRGLTGLRSFATRDEAAELVATAFHNAEREFYR